MKKTIQLLTLLCLLCQTGIGPVALGEYLIRSPQASPTAFEAAVYTRKGLRNWADATASPTPQQKEQLTRLLEQAQRAFLGDSLESAQAQFKLVVDQAMNADWDPASVDAITFAYFRLAQMTDNSSEKRTWIRKALVFRQDLVIDQESFPPPLVAAARDEKAQLEREAVVWEPELSFRTYDRVRLNAKTIRLKEAAAVRVWPGEYRVTASSSAHTPFTQVMKADDLVDFRLNRAPLVDGDCDNPSWRGKVPTDAVIYYGDSCMKTQRDGVWVNVAPVVAMEDLTKVEKPTNAVASVAVSSEPPRRWYRNPWVWVGAAVLLTGITIAVVSDQKKYETPPPIHPTNDLQPASTSTP